MIFTCCEGINAYLYIYDTSSEQTLLNGAFPNRFEFLNAGITEDVVTGELVWTLVEEAARRSPEGVFLSYHFDNPGDDSDEAVPQTGYALEIDIPVPRNDGIIDQVPFIIGSGFYPERLDALKAVTNEDLTCPTPAGVSIAALPNPRSRHKRPRPPSVCSGSSSARQLTPRIYAAILSGLGVSADDLARLGSADPAVAGQALGGIVAKLSAEEPDGAFSFGGGQSAIPAASGHAAVYYSSESASPIILLAGFDLSEVYLVDFDEENLAAGLRGESFRPGRLYR